MRTSEEIAEARTNLRNLAEVSENLYLNSGVIGAVRALDWVEGVGPTQPYHPVNQAMWGTP